MRALYVRLFADASGVSHFEDLEVEMVPGCGTSRRAALSRAVRGDLEMLVDRREVRLEWRYPAPAPYRFLLVNIRGEFQVTAGDGAVRDVVPGSVMLVEDTWGTGHSTRSTSGDEGLCLFFELPDSTG
jgi:hypothetical protein